MIRIANRVCQLETNILDVEFNKILDNYVDGLELNRYSDEVKLITKLYLSSNLILNDFSTVGMKVFNMSLYDSSSMINRNPELTVVEPKKIKLISLTAFNLLLPYVMNQAKDSDIARKAISSLEYPWLSPDNIEAMIRMLKVINFVVFLREGKYLNIQRRLLGLVPGIDDKYYGVNLGHNHVQMQMIHRATILKSFAEFLTILIPSINGTWLKNKSFKLISWLKPNSSIDESSSLSESIGLKYGQKNYSICGICSKQPFNPRSIGCRHVFCYYCINSQYLIDPSDGYKCRVCNYKTSDDRDVIPIKVY